MNLCTKPSMHPNIHSKSQDFLKNPLDKPCPATKHVKKKAPLTRRTSKADWTRSASLLFQITWFPMSTCQANMRKDGAPRTWKTEFSALCSEFSFCPMDVVCVCLETFSVWWREMGQDRESHLCSWGGCVTRPVRRQREVPGLAPKSLVPKLLHIL